MSRVSQNILVSTNFSKLSESGTGTKFSKLSESGTVNRRKRQKEEDRNVNKKMKQSRIFLYQLYPIYKI